MHSKYSTMSDVFLTSNLGQSHSSWQPLLSSMACFFWLSHYFLSHSPILTPSFQFLSQTSYCSREQPCDTHTHIQWHCYSYLCSTYLVEPNQSVLCFCPWSLPCWFLWPNNCLQSDLSMGFRLIFAEQLLENSTRSTNDLFMFHMPKLYSKNS